MVSNSFRLCNEKFDVELEKETLLDFRAGAISTFEGRVRNHNEGMQVSNLTYEAYDSMAYKIAEVIMQEAKIKFGILEARAIHRTGKLEIGELAVWVGVSSAHRKEAFQACQYIIDEIKHRLPIWKREVYKDGSYKWVNCQSCTNGRKNSQETKQSLNQNSTSSISSESSSKTAPSMANSKGESA